jgi:hypothetical protein
MFNHGDHIFAVVPNISLLYTLKVALSLYRLIPPGEGVIMGHDVFISYSSKDKPIADGICANLEAAGLRCWIAPRDIHPGEDWPKAITTAISDSKVMVLVFSASSNSSDDVSREIILAATSKLVIIPFKIEDIEPEPGKRYYLARTHWLEAMNPPTREQIRTLVETVRSVVITVVPEGILQPKPSDMTVKEQPVPVAKSNTRSWSLWVIGLLVVVILGILFWPKLQGMVASSTATPTLTATTTLQPTSTHLPTATATKISIPSATPTTGTVTGQVLWGEQPFEGVNIQLCADPIFNGNCKELFAEVVTGADGKFNFDQVEPGKYTIIPFTQGDLGLMIDKDTYEVTVFAGQTTTLETFGLCKYNFNAYTPVVTSKGNVTLHWSTSPSNLYTWYFGDIYENGEASYWVEYTSITTDRGFNPGTYVFFVRASPYGSTGYSCSISWFTIP